MNAQHRRCPIKRTAQKRQKFKLFKLLRLASSRALGGDNASREGNALAALQPASEPLICPSRRPRTLTRRTADFPFPNGIADTDDHEHLGYCE